jgi:hypothetical protein
MPKPGREPGVASGRVASTSPRSSPNDVAKPESDIKTPEKGSTMRRPASSLC